MKTELSIPAPDAKKAGDTYLRRFRRCPENPRMSLDEWRLLLWIEALGEDYEDLAEVIYMKWRKLRYRNMALTESTASLLKKLHKQYQLALITNGPSNSQWEKIRELKLEEYFDCILVSGDLKYEKPAKEIFQRAIDKLGVQPFETMMVGDRLETDIKGGNLAQVGITVWVPLDEPGHEAPSPPPDFIIRDISQLLGILQGGNEKKSKGLQRTSKGKSSGNSSGSSSNTAGSSSSSSLTTNSSSPTAAALPSATAVAAKLVTTSGDEEKD